MSRRLVSLFLLLSRLGKTACFEFLGCGRAINKANNNVAQLKQDIVNSVAQARRREGDRRAIIAAVDKLEDYLPQSKVDLRLLDGAWSLIYSTRVSTASESSGTIIDNASASLYKIFFKFAPALAGAAQEEKRIASNVQTIDLGAGKIENVVKIRRPIAIDIMVSGEISASPASADTIDVVFTSCNINGLTIPLPRPRGTLRTTYVDSDFRLGRGGQGGLFIVKKI